MFLLMLSILIILKISSWITVYNSTCILFTPKQWSIEFLIEESSTIKIFKSDQRLKSLLSFWGNMKFLTFFLYWCVYIIGEFRNAFRFHAHSVSKRLLLMTSSLSDLATTNVCKVNASLRICIWRSRWMTSHVTRY